MSQTIEAMTGSRLSEGTIDGYMRSFADRFQAVHRRLGDLAQVAEISHFDETGMRVEGSLNGFHMATTELFCYLWLGQSRGDVMTAFKTIAVHDHWRSYRKHMPEARHAYCRAHRARECVGLAEKGEAWADKMADLLYEMIRANQQARDQHRPLTPSVLTPWLLGLTDIFRRVWTTIRALILCPQEGREEESDDISVIIWRVG